METREKCTLRVRIKSFTLTVVQHTELSEDFIQSQAFKGKPPIFPNSAKAVTLLKRVPSEPLQDVLCSSAQGSDVLH